MYCSPKSYDVDLPYFFFLLGPKIRLQNSLSLKLLKMWILTFSLWLWEYVCVCVKVVILTPHPVPWWVNLLIFKNHLSAKKRLAHMYVPAAPLHTLHPKHSVLGDVGGLLLSKTKSGDLGQCDETKVGYVDMEEFTVRKIYHQGNVWRWDREDEEEAVQPGLLWRSSFSQDGWYSLGLNRLVLPVGWAPWGVTSSSTSQATAFPPEQLATLRHNLPH